MQSQKTETGPARPALGGVSATELAAVYGTPLLAIDTEVLEGNIAGFERASAELDIDVCYAAKALLFVALARRIAASSLGLDVCSLGELVTAERAGMPPERLVLHGCGKTDEELRAAIDGRVGRIVVDHYDELESIARLTRSAGTARSQLRVLLRVNTGIEAQTHAYVRTGGEESKFGFLTPEVDGAIRMLGTISGLSLVGVHSHIGSQIYEAGPYAASLPIALDAYERMLALGAPVRDLVLGGGFGVESRPAGERLDLGGLLSALASELAAQCAARGIAPPHLGIEPGRSLIANAGTSLYRVVAVKRQGTRRFAIVDGGIADNPRPALYGAYHHPQLAGRRSEAALVETTVCGRSCENDRLVVASLPLDLTAGDIVSLGTTGAYTFSMASNYNRFSKPAVVFAGAGSHRLVVRREATDDVLRNDVLDG